MSLQPALDHIGLEAMRRGLDIYDAEMSWEPAADGRGVHVEFLFPDGTLLQGYAPDGMASFEAQPTETGETPASPLDSRLH